MATELKPVPVMLTFRCPGCGDVFHASSELSGKPARCKRCGTRTQVPEAPQEYCPAHYTPSEPIEVGVVEAGVTRRPTPPPLPSRREIRQPEPATWARRARWPACAALAVIALLGIAALGSVAGSGVPSEADAREVFQDLSHIPAELATLESFKKTDGHLTCFMGEYTYKIEYEAVVRGRRQHVLEETWGVVCKTKPEHPHFQRPTERWVAPGQKAYVTGSLEFVKSEKGWRARNQKYY